MKYLPDPEEMFQHSVVEAMNYSVTVGGKRLRPLLMQETYRMFRGQDEIVEPFMAAIEMIHTYSLVHDDLPCMDNDTLRRGRETTWKKYGEAMAVLAGDGLLNYAFETAMKSFDLIEKEGALFEVSSETIASRYQSCAKALTVLAEKAGIRGMVGGQCLDVEAEEKDLSLSEEELLFIHEHKTAALIQACFMIGGVLAGAGKRQIERLEKIGYNVGVAFQIRDDMLDVIGDTETLGKNVGSDEKDGKKTYVTLHGLEQSEADEKHLTEEALELLEGLPGKHEFMEELILSLLGRRS
ncbi:MAG: polyprenyl synthetase family protein [Lachnospiraceae bacterium]|nr:polyprenyl synthetase family protein [Lachnospiraceae bacterium]